MERSESRASGEAPYGTLLPHGVMDTTPHAQGLATALASVPRMVSTGRKRSDDEAHNNGATSYPLRSDKQVDSTDESPSKIVQLHRRGAMPLSAESQRANEDHDDYDESSGTTNASNDGIRHAAAERAEARQR
jgi:hypothetical protein